MSWDADAQMLESDGTGATPGSVLVAFLPGTASTDDVSAEGTGDVQVVPAPNGGSFVVAKVDRVDWSFSATSSS